MLDPSNIEAIYPLSAAQLGLLFEHVSQGDGDLGKICVSIEGSGTVSFQTLKQAWADVVSSQPALRSSIHWRKMKKPQWVVLRKTEWEGAVCEEREDPNIEGAGSAVTLRRSDFWLDSIELDQVPPWRWMFTRVDEDRFSVKWHCHHALLDGWSASLIINQWFHRTNQILRGAPSSLVSYDKTFREIVRWRKGRDTKQLGDYWKRVFGRAPEMASIGATPGRKFSQKGRSRTSLALSQGESRLLRQALKSYRISGNVLAVAAWVLVLNRLSENSLVSFGIVVSGRSLPIDRIDEVAGMFTGILPVISQIDEADSVRSLLADLREQLVEGQSRAPGTIGELEEWTGSSSIEKMIASVLLFQEFGRDTEQSNGDEVTLKGYQSEVTTRFPLVVAVLPDEAWELYCDFDPSVHSQADIELIIKLFQSALLVMGRGGVESVGALVDQLRNQPAPRLNEIEFQLVPSHPAQEVKNERLDSLQWRVLMVFRVVFENDRVGPRDDFFELGGNSILAGRLFHRIEQEFGVVLPLVTIVEHRSAASLAGCLVDVSSQVWRSLAPLRSDGVRPGLFCLHAGGMEVLIYHSLATSLSTPRPVLGIQPPGLRDGSLPESMAALARAYVAEIREAQPSGPYHFLVYCFGVRVVVPMIRELTEELGEKVSLTVIDTGPPIRSRTGKEELSASPSKVILGLAGTLIRGRFDLLSGRWSRAISSFRYHWDRCWIRMVGSETARHRLAVGDAVLRLADDGIQGPLKADCLLIRSSETATRREKDFHLEWEKYTSSFESLTLPTRHHDMLMPENALVVANVIEPFLLSQDRGE